MSEKPEWSGDWSSDDAPDWPPRVSASSFPDGYAAFGSTGQRWIASKGQWVRVKSLKVVPPGG